MKETWVPMVGGSVATFFDFLFLICLVVSPPTSLCFFGGVVGSPVGPGIPTIRLKKTPGFHKSSGDRKKAINQGFGVGYQWQYALDMMQGGVEDQGSGWDRGFASLKFGWWLKTWDFQRKKTGIPKGTKVNNSSVLGTRWRLWFAYDMVYVCFQTN